MKKLIFFFISLTLLSNGCISTYSSGSSVREIIEDPNDDFNIASHNDSIYIYKNFNSEELIATIPSETNFRVDRKTTIRKTFSRRKVIYGNYKGWVRILSYKNEMDYGKWAHDRVMEQIGIKGGGSTSSQSSNSSYGQGHVYQTGPRGGQYYINKNGNKTYRKRN